MDASQKKSEAVSATMFVLGLVVCGLAALAGGDVVVAALGGGLMIAGILVAAIELG